MRLRFLAIFRPIFRPIFPPIFRPILLATLAICSLAVLGCGSSGSGTQDADSGRGGAAGGRDGMAADRPADLSPGASDAPADLVTDRRDGTVASDGGAAGRDGGGDAIADARDGGAADARADRGIDAGVDGARDVAAPTCSDLIKNSDETDVDCGGHCGTCPTDKICVIGADCSFGVCRSDHTCGACAIAADCPGTESECQHRSCTAGVCGITREPAGKVLAMQTSGDCKSRKCADDTTVVVVIDNSDLPDDRNPCTNDFCMAGTPSHTMLPANSGCGGLNRCDANGQCVGCTMASDCPGSDTPCQTRLCGPQGVCGFTFRARGTRLTDPSPGDCKGLECDGAGNNAVANDNSDLPADNNACTTDECTAGTPSHRPVGAGTACGTGGLLCDGANRCVACLSAATCPGTDTECRPRSCVNGACGFANTVGGTPKTAQVAKDCKRILCDGAGGEFTVPDGADLPVDGNPCTADLCSGSVPSNPALGAGSSCGGSSVCDGQGACVGCLTAATCPGDDTECHTRSCTGHMCGLANALPGKLLALQRLGDCKRNECDGNGNPRTVNDGTDLPIDGNVCTQDLCVAGAASNPPESSGKACGAGLLCDGMGSCVGCRNVGDCPGADTACQTRVCTAAGHCEVSNVMPGTVVATQTPRDCKRNQCDGMGNAVPVADDGDAPIDGNPCTQDVCTLGVPSNPPEPADTACSQNGGTRCNGVAGSEACVQCNAASQCPGGPDDECHTRTCSAAGRCDVSFSGAGTTVSSQFAGDCKRRQCDGHGIVEVVADSNDRPIDGIGCTRDLCTGSTPSNPPETRGTPCADGDGAVCDGAGTCLQCNAATDCAGGPDTECHVRVCGAGRCSVRFADRGARVAAQTSADCHVNVCDGSGAVISPADDTDIFVDGNACTSDLCTIGVASNPPVARGTACQQNNGSLCDDGGTCVQCLGDANCDNTHDTACNKIHCVAGACVFVPEASGKPVGDTISGDCQSDACDATGSIGSAANDSDLPVDGNSCTRDVCTDGIATNPPEAAGTPCGQNGGVRCDATAACVPAFMVARIGDGTATLLSNAATPLFIEERLESDGTLVRTIALPSAAGTAPKPLTLSGTADSEGALALSGDGHSLAVAGYAAAAATAAVASTASTVVQRAGALIFPDGSVDTSTTFGTTAFTANNVRSAVSGDGTQLWAAGNGTNPTRGVVFAATGAVTSTVIETASNSTRVCAIVAGQLYCDAANGALGIFAVGTGLPTGAATILSLPGTTVDAAASYYAFVLLDMVGADGVPDTLYLADDRATAAGGIQKWTLNAGIWTPIWATNTIAGTAGVRGLTGYAAGSRVVLLATTASASPAPNTIIRLIDTGATPTAADVTTLVQAIPGAVTVYRGLALAPR